MKQDIDRPPISRLLLRSLRYPVWLILLLLAIYGLLFLDWREEALCFTSPRLNVLAIIAGLLIPLICLVLLSISVHQNRHNGWGTACGLTALGFLTLASLALMLPVFLTESYTLQTDRSDELELYSRVPVSGTPVRIYRRGIYDWECVNMLVRQECPILPGLIWTTPLYEQLDSRDVTVTVLDAHRFRCVFTSDDSRLNEPGKQPTVILTNH